MSTMQELKDAVTTARAALDVARSEYEQARNEVDQALSAVNVAVADRVKAQDSTTQIPIAALKFALDRLTAIEKKYSVPAGETS